MKTCPICGERYDEEKDPYTAIIAGAGLAAALPGVIASKTMLPIIGVPIANAFEGLDALLSIIQMPPGIPVATVALDGARNAGILAAQIIGTGEPEIMERVIAFKASLEKKIIQANEELAKIKYEYKVN